MSKYLEIQDLKVIYTSDEETVYAVNGVDLSLERGQTLGLVGETGAGKTTIAKSILRILPERQSRITGGEIRIQGENLLQKPERDMLSIRGNKVAMIFQDPMTALNPTMTVGDQISEVIALHNKGTRLDAEKRTIEMLEMVGIPAERYLEYPHQFSGGMKQRVVIAMALACNPELLLADEPTTALDVTIQAQVLDMINNLKKKFNTAMMLITHDLGVVAETCDTVAVIYAGQVVEYASKEELFDHKQHPYTLGLFSSVPDMKDDTRRLKPIPGLPPDPTCLPEGCTFHPRCPYATEDCKHVLPELREIAPGHLCRCHKTDRQEV